MEAKKRPWLIGLPLGSEKPLERLWGRMAAPFVALVIVGSLADDPDRAVTLCERAREEAKRPVSGAIRAVDGLGRLAIRDGTLEEAREEGEPFWLVSSHGDPAKGHEPWQGIWCYDERDKEASKEGRALGLASFQWLTWEPVYMLTRPNCRHYMTSVTRAYFESHSAKEALKDLGMESDIGERGKAQTLPPLTPDDVAKEEYKARWLMYRAMYAENPTAKLKGLMEKMRFLMSIR